MKTPITTGSDAAQTLRAEICKARGWTVGEFDFYWRGIVQKTADRKTVKIVRDEAAPIQNSATHAYYGGRNECFLVGIHPSADGWSDFDLTGAYPTAMALVPDADYSAPTGLLAGRLMRGSITPQLIVFPLVDFVFPVDTMYPCIPVSDDQGRGLIFPLAGRAMASAPELYLALEMGATIDVVQPAVMMQAAQTYSMADGVKNMIASREEAKQTFGKGSPQERNAKEKVNSAYGKTAQGLQQKKSYSTRIDGYQTIGPSIVTNAYAAAMTTGLVRAIVSAALVQLHQCGYKVASVTTDGFLTDAPMDVLDNLTLFGFAGMFRRSRENLTGNSTIWELKHACKTLVMMKTRGGVGLDGEKLPVAKAGYKLPQIDQQKTAADTNKALAVTYLNRASAHIPYLIHALPAPKEYVRKDADGVGHIQKRSANWDFDYKREPAAYWDDTLTIDTVDYNHVCFATKPWANMESFDKARAVREATHKAVKSSADLEDMTNRIAFRASADARARISRYGIQATKATQIMRAVRNGLLTGVETGRGSGRNFVNKLEAHFQVSIKNDAWTDAARARLNLICLDGLEPDIEALGLSRALAGHK
jgi:hypothetical protein